MAVLSWDYRAAIISQVAMTAPDRKQPVEFCELRWAYVRFRSKSGKARHLLSALTPIADE
jgi:hypothetical protein